MTRAETHPLARRSPALLWLFQMYLRWFIWRKFDAVRLSRTGMPQAHAGSPLVIYCNHPSWWDPALLLLALPKLFPARRGFAPMETAELERYGLFKRMGMFGISSGSLRDAAKFLAIAQEGLSQPDTCLCLTAEGKFTDPRTRPIRLRPGLAHLARRHPDAVFLPLALEYSFWNESKPEALLRFGVPVRAKDNTVAAWQGALENGLAETMDTLAIESAMRDSTHFVELFRGTAGIGGIYDLWRRARAAISGERFNPRHELGPP